MCTGMPRMCSKTSPSRGENCHENIASGIWKFRVGVMTSEDKLVCLAREWYRAEPDRYLDLHIRACSGSQIGIGFKIKYSANADGKMGKATDSMSFERFFEQKTDELRRLFGNDFVGWDIGHPSRVICQTVI